MKLAPLSLAPLENRTTEAAAVARSKRALEGSSSGTNAFAATLAGAIHPPPAPMRDAKHVDANSDLDVRAAGVGARGDNGKPAFAAAAEARAAAVSTPVASPNSDADALNPDFRSRLGRVITRMHDEFGKDVQLVEGFRTQSRQDFLYDQGRTRPGDVVTWTKSSKHTLGLAADVTIDGSYTDTTGFQQLAQIAAQEGLRTLGAKDPGHIEMPTHGGAGAWGTPADATNIDDNVSRAIGIALDQGPAIVDSSKSNDGIGNFNGLLSRAGRSVTGAPPILMPSMSAGGGGMRGSTSGRNGEGTQRDSATASPGEPARVAKVADVAQVAQVAQVAHTGPAIVSQGHATGATVVVPAGSAAAERVGSMLDARDASPAAPLSHVTLNVDNGAGGSDRITVQLRAGAVDTAISLGDPNRADRMSLRVGELQHALEQHGLDATAISVGSSSKSTGPGWTPRQGSDQSTHDGNSSLNHRDNRQDADATRQRSRREQQGGRQK